MTQNADSLVDQAKEWASHYGGYTLGEPAAVYTAALRARGAWAANDADGLAEAFAENGSLLLGDRQLTGREEIRSYMAEAFLAGLKGSSLVDEPLEIRMLGEGAALAITEGGIKMAADAELPGDQRSRTSWLIVSRDGEWQVLSRQSSPLGG